MKTCRRNNCDNPLNTGLEYCSKSCAAKDRPNKKVVVMGSVESSPIEKGIRDVLGDDANIVLKEASETPFRVPYPSEQRTLDDILLSFDGLRDLRPTTKLRFDIIEQMLKSGPATFVMEIKRSQVARVFAPGRFRVLSPDKELAAIAEASLNTILPKMASDFTFSSFAYGSSFQELMWHWQTKYQLGLSRSKAGTTSFRVPRVPASINPATVDHIRRTADEKFNGFAQKRRNSIVKLTPTSTASSSSNTDLINIEADAALVIPLNERFGNLWGESFLKPLYVIWLWYELILRAMHRYMTRMATPITVGRAPSRGTATVEGHTEEVKAMELILAIAGNVAKSNAVAIPSDRDEDGNYLWNLEYLSAQESAQPFINVLEYLGQEMLRAGLSADRSVTQASGGTGSYAIGLQHARVSAMTSELIVIQFLYYLNKYFMPGYSKYNRGGNGPPIRLVVQAIDMQERELLMKLISIAGNSEAGTAFFEMIDWRTLADTSNVPSLDEAQTKKLKEERLQESLDRQKQQQEMMQKFNVDGKLQPKKNEPDKKVEAKPDNVKQENEAIDWAKNNMPLILGEDDVSILAGN